MQLYMLDRFVDGIKMAEGTAVYAASEVEAEQKARKLFEHNANPGEMERTEFVLDHIKKVDKT